MIDTRKKLQERLREALQFAEAIKKISSTASFGDTEKTSESRQVVKIGCSTLYIMIYSAIELTVKLCMHKIEREIETSGSRINNLSCHWKSEFLKRKYLQKMQDGTNNSAVLDSIIDDLFSESNGSRFIVTNNRNRPNIGVATLNKIKESLDLEYDPRGYACGAEIETIRTRRNALSHGDESFSEAGEVVSIDDIIEMIPRIENNLLDFINSAETYILKRQFLEM